MKYIVKIKVLLILVLGVVGLASCEDPVPTDYTPENLVEAVLFVGRPIENIRVTRSQPINAVYSNYKAAIKDAEVYIIEANNRYKLTFLDDTLSPGYYYEDKSVIVKPNTEYKLEIKLKDGTLMTGTTTTPGEFDWAKKLNGTLQYPKDTLKLPATDTIAWNKVANHDFYAIQIIPMDTLNYGKYLSPATDELNRRVYNPNREDENYYERSSMALIPNTRSSVVWSVFKWFGKHKVNITCPDYNYLRWMYQNMSAGTITDILGSIKGGNGVFGSASMISDTVFVLKNQK